MDGPGYTAGTMVFGAAAGAVATGVGAGTGSVDACLRDVLIRFVAGAGDLVFELVFFISVDVGVGVW